MPIHKFQGEDGKIHKFEAPEGMPVEQVFQAFSQLRPDLGMESAAAQPVQEISKQRLSGQKDYSYWINLYRQGQIGEQPKAFLEELARRGEISLDIPVEKQRASEMSMQEIVPGTKSPPDALSRLYTPALETAGMIGGGIAGTAASPGAGTVAGAGLGYAGGKKVAEILDVAQGIRQPGTLGEELTGTAKDVATGVTMEMGGQIIAKTAPIAIKAVAKPISKGVKEVFGAITGKGPGMIEAALKGGERFKAAMRGKVEGFEVVEHALDALRELKIKRSGAYKKAYNKLIESKKTIDFSPISKKLDDLMENFNVKIENGKINIRKIGMGETGRNDIAKMLDDAAMWAKDPEGSTLKGLDAFKQQVDDFYSESSQARAFASSLRQTIKQTIEDAFPAYAKMTKKYAEATTLIKDLEAGLMLKKQGMTGRITADATLRRLLSAMRENFELRKELVEILGQKTGEDLAGEIGGYAASQLVPAGLVGKMASGSAAYLSYLNPKFLPLLAASSPRLTGEFMNLLGATLRAAGKAGPTASKTAGYYLGKKAESISKKGIEETDRPY